MPFSFTITCSAIQLERNEQLARLPYQSIVFHKLPDRVELIETDLSEAEQYLIQDFFRELLSIDTGHIDPNSFNQKYQILLNNAELTDSLIEFITEVYNENIFRFTNKTQEILLLDTHLGQLEYLKEIQSRLNFTFCLLTILGDPLKNFDKFLNYKTLICFFLNDIHSTLKNTSEILYLGVYPDKELEAIASIFDKTLKTHTKKIKPFTLLWLTLYENPETKARDELNERCYFLLTLCSLRNYQVQYLIASGDIKKAEAHLNWIKEMRNQFSNHYKDVSLLPLINVMSQEVDARMSILRNEITSNPIRHIYAELCAQIRLDLKLADLQNDDVSKLESDIELRITALRHMAYLNREQLKSDIMLIQKISLQKNLPTSLERKAQACILEMNRLLETDKGSIVAIRIRSYLIKLSKNIRKMVASDSNPITSFPIATCTDEFESKDFLIKDLATTKKKKRNKKKKEAEPLLSELNDSQLAKKIEVPRIKNKDLEVKLNKGQRKTNQTLASCSQKLTCLQTKIELLESNLSDLDKYAENCNSSRKSLLASHDKAIENLSKQKDKIIQENKQLKIELEKNAKERDFLEHQQEQALSLKIAIDQIEAESRNYQKIITESEEALAKLKQEVCEAQDREANNLIQKINTFKQENEQLEQQLARQKQEIEVLEQPVYFNILPVFMPFAATNYPISPPNPPLLFDSNHPDSPLPSKDTKSNTKQLSTPKLTPQERKLHAKK